MCRSVSSRITCVSRAAPRVGLNRSKLTSALGPRRELRTGAALFDYVPNEHRTRWHRIAVPGRRGERRLPAASGRSPPTPGVSVGTVSNVLNRPEIVAEPTREPGQAAIKQLGFVSNESARQLRAGRSRTIGLVVLDVANPFFTDVARGVEDEASESGLAVILCNSDDQLAKERRYLELLEEHRVQGILITPVVRRRRARSPGCSGAGTPGRPGRQPVADPGPVLGLGGRRARRRAGHRPPARGRARARSPSSAAR